MAHQFTKLIATKPKIKTDRSEKLKTARRNFRNRQYKGNHRFKEGLDEYLGGSSQSRSISFRAILLSAKTLKDLPKVTPPQKPITTPRRKHSKVMCTFRIEEIVSLDQIAKPTEKMLKQIIYTPKLTMGVSQGLKQKFCDEDLNLSECEPYIQEGLQLNRRSNSKSLDSSVELAYFDIDLSQLKSLKKKKNSGSEFPASCSKLVRKKQFSKNDILELRAVILDGLKYLQKLKLSDPNLIYKAIWNINLLCRAEYIIRTHHRLEAPKAFGQLVQSVLIETYDRLSAKTEITSKRVNDWVKCLDLALITLINIDLFTQIGLPRDMQQKVIPNNKKLVKNITKNGAISNTITFRRFVSLSFFIAQSNFDTDALKEVPLSQLSKKPHTSIEKWHEAQPFLSIANKFMALFEALNDLQKQLDNCTENPSPFHKFFTVYVLNVLSPLFENGALGQFAKHKEMAEFRRLHQLDNFFKTPDFQNEGRLTDLFPDLDPKKDDHFITFVIELLTTHQVCTILKEVNVSETEGSKSFEIIPDRIDELFECIGLRDLKKQTIDNLETEFCGVKGNSIQTVCAMSYQQKTGQELPGNYKRSFGNLMVRIGWIHLWHLPEQNQRSLKGLLPTLMKHALKDINLGEIFKSMKVLLVDHFEITSLPLIRLRDIHLPIHQYCREVDNQESSFWNAVSTLAQHTNTFLSDLGKCVAELIDTQTGFKRDYHPFDPKKKLKLDNQELEALILAKMVMKSKGGDYQYRDCALKTTYIMSDNQKRTPTVTGAEKLTLFLFDIRCPQIEPNIAQVFQFILKMRRLNLL